MTLREARPACRDCALGALGGPAENPFTAFDSICPSQGCADAGQPQILINTSNLNLHVRVVDLKVAGPAPALVLATFYSSDAQANGVSGNGWSFSLGDTLAQEADSSWVLRRGSGRIDRFGPAVDPAQFFAITPTTDVLTRNADGSFTLRNPQANTVRTFDSGGRLTSLLDAGVTGVQLRYTAGRLTSALPRGSSARPVQFSYTGDGHLSNITDQSGRSVSFAYDGQANLVQQTNADGSTVSYTYDGNGRLAAIATAAGQTIITYSSDPDFSGVTAISLPDGSSRQYTALGGRQVQVTDGAGNVSVYTSTVPGQTQTIVDPAGNVTAYTYDPAGHRTSTTTAAGAVIQLAYDGSGNLTSVTDPTQNRWTGAYNGSNLTQLSDAGKNIWQFTYDSAGHLNGLADPYGDSTTAARNAAGLVTSLADPNGNQSTFQYDADGLLSKWVDPLGGTWSYQYDGALNVSSRTDPAGATLQATYDTQNRLQAVTSSAGSIQFDYSGVQRDALNRVASSTDSFGNQITYGYNTGGRLASMTLPGGNAISYQYDTTGRLAKVSDWLGNFATYKYDATGLVSSVSIATGPVTVYQYDTASNLRALISAGANGVVAGYRYTVDGNGNRVTLSAAEPSTAPISLNSASLTYNAANLLTGSSAGRTYRYDASGRLLEIQGAGATTSFSYDLGGRLIAAGGTQSTYDGLGLRVERDTADGARRFVYDLSGARPRIVMETDGANNVIAYYVWGLGLLWKIIGSGQIFFYHFDGDGNVVAVSSASAGVVNRYRYDPLGTLIASDETVENEFRARGQSGWVDDGDGLLYGDGNYYSPELRHTLPGTVSLGPPETRIVPRFAGAGACFIDGVANCALASGRRAQ